MRLIIAALAGIVLAGCADLPEQPPVAAAGTAVVEETPAKTYPRPEERFPGERFPIRLINMERVSPEYRPAVVANTMGLAPGTILVDTAKRQLFYAQDAATVRRYGIAVGESGKAWSGTAHVGRKAKWPNWYPTDEMHRSSPGLERMIPSGPENPLGARALYLYKNGRDTLYRIHGTSAPWTIGTDVSSGCIRMFNEDVADLYELVKVGSKVIVR